MSPKLNISSQFIFSTNRLFMSKILEKVCLLNYAPSCKKMISIKISIRFQVSSLHRNCELVKITNDLLLASDQGCISLLVLLDLSAVFDTIDHDILIDRLQNYMCIQGQALGWFRSYLSDHYHFFLFKLAIMSINASKVWSAARICLRPSAIFNIHVAPW